MSLSRVSSKTEPYRGWYGTVVETHMTVPGRYRVAFDKHPSGPVWKDYEELEFDPPESNSPDTPAPTAPTPEEKSEGSITWKTERSIPWEEVMAMADGEFEPDDTPNMVNKVPHYNQGGIECIDAIRAALTPEEFRGFLKGNVLKYVWRERHKGGVESLRKAAWYLDRLIRVSGQEGGE